MNATETFRDHITTEEGGDRKWLYPQKPFGPLFERRKLVSYVLLLLFFGTPFLHWHGEPLFLFNVLERKFNIFGMVFLPQDFILFGLAMLSFMVGIVLFTAIYGRVWCGWICPQTIFMEMVFRRIEYAIDGDHVAQRRLKSQAWNSEKWRKRAIKYTIFYIISFLIANLFISYIVGVKELGKVIWEGIGPNAGLFTAVLVFSVIFFFVFTYVREQACILVCPYGRLQGVLLDKNSMGITYDYVRGEPRGKASKKNDATVVAKKAAPGATMFELPVLHNEAAAHHHHDDDDCACVGCDGNGSCKDKAPKEVVAPTLGDCIDCGLCVRVCPTGIDIRNGTQLECVNCTACIDACDGIMDKIGKPRGLIRYASEEQIRKKEGFKLTPRVIGYTGFLLVLVGVFGFMFATRGIVESSFLRTPGLLFQRDTMGNISNLYNFKIQNKGHEDLPLTIKIDDLPAAKIRFVGDSTLMAPKGGYVVGEFFVVAPENKIQKRHTKFRISIWSNGKQVDELTSNFVAPGQ